MDDEQDVFFLDEEEPEMNQPVQQQNNPEQPQTQTSEKVEQPIFKEHEEYPDQDAVFINDEPESTKTEKGFGDYFAKGLKESVSGEINELLFEKLPKKDKAIAEQPEFWNSIIESSGTLVGDAPYIIAGGTIGAALGGEIGSMIGPFGAVAGAVSGAGAGGTAFPAFLKEAIREYREFQESGNNLTFEQFLKSSEKIANSTLNEGINGAFLGMVNKGMPLLKKIPYLDKLFNAKYVGKPAYHATALGLEATAAVGFPAISQGKIPSANDISHAAVLFAGMKLNTLPGQIKNAWKHRKSDGFNLALATEIQNQNLAYPPLQELKKGKSEQVYENNIELDRNLAAFDESFAKNISERINAISPTELESTHDAGTLMRTMLLGQTPETTPEALSSKKITRTAPVFQETPLIQNPINDGLSIISPTTFHSDLQAGNRIREIYHKNRTAAQNPLRERFVDLKEQTRGVEFIDTEAPDLIRNFIREFEGSIVPGSPEAQLLNVARTMLNRFEIMNEKGEPTGNRNVNAADLIADNRAIKSIPDYEIIPEMKNNLGRLTEAIDNIIEGHLEQADPSLATEYRDLNADYSTFKRRYDNSDTQILWKGTEKGQAIYKKFSKTDQFVQLADALETSPEGVEVLNQMRRDIWTNELPAELLNATTESEFANALERVNDRQFNNLADVLTPQQQASMVNSIAQGNQLRSSAQMAAQQHDLAIRQFELNKLADKQTQETAKDIQTKQSVLVSLLSKDPAKLMQNMNTIEGIQRTYAALDKVKGGLEAKHALARFETENMLGFLRDGYVETNRVPYAKLKSQMQNKDFRRKLSALNGPEFVKSLDSLVELTDNLSKDYKEKLIKYKNDPSTYSSLINLGTVLGIASSGNIITPLVVHGKTKTLQYGLEKTKNFWVDKVNYDQAHIKKAVQAAYELKYGTAKTIQEKAHQIAPVRTKKP